MHCIILILNTFVTLVCPTPPENAAAILANSPGLSNRTNIHKEYKPSLEERSRHAAFLAELRAAPPSFVRTPPALVLPTAEKERAKRMGIPGEWTPLEWAIISSGSTR